MRLAILSDLHIDRRADSDSWNLAKVAFRTASKHDHVIVAGDLFDWSGAMRRDRDALERELRRLDLWNPDRLTVAVGNHDIFPVTSDAELPTNLAEAMRAAKKLVLTGRHAYDEFGEWIGELVPDDDRAYADDVFPYRRTLDGVTIIAGDSTPGTVIQASEGQWSEEEDAGVRELLEDADGVKVLVTHYPPLETDSSLSWLDKLNGYVGGFPDDDLERLQDLVDDCGVKAVVCGHIHADADAWNWRFGRRSRAFLMGRTGGRDGATPLIGVLDVPRRGPVKWITKRL